MIKKNFEELKNIASYGLKTFRNDPKLLGFLALAYDQSDQKEKVEMLKQNYKLSEFPELLFYDISRDLKKVRKVVKLRLKPNITF